MTLGLKDNLRSRLKVAVAALATLVLVACAGPSVRPVEPDADNISRGDQVGECARLFRDLDAKVSAAGVADAQSQRVPGFPYVRVNRLLASFDLSSSNTEAFDVWLQQLVELDAQARNAELSNLKPADQVAPRTLHECRDTLRTHDMSRPESRARLVAQAVARSSYQSAKRAIGLYPLTAMPMRWGVTKLNRETADRFALPLEALPVDGQLTRYLPAPTGKSLASHEVASIVHRASLNELDMPLPSPAELEQLFYTFAPIWEVDVASDDDRLGAPTFAGRDVAIDTSEPHVYTLASHTRLAGETLLQLNYVIWFPARPRRGAFDLLGGAVDGITWRVTIDTDGRAILYDAMHNCGCYYMAFPTRLLASKASSQSFEEPLSVPQWLVARDTSARTVVRVQSATHYLSRIYHAPDAQTGTSFAYELRDYASLRSLETSSGNRSLFAPDSIVKGSERGERWFFWPMGVPEPGAMRQWGNHAIAFVGRRHFDDPDLIERYFSRAP